MINRKRNILRSHTKAVVNDAVAKAQDYISQGEFDKAKEAIEAAERVVSKNRLYLGDDLFKQYSSQLKQLSGKIVQRESERIQQSREQKRLEAIEAQRQYRQQMEVDRSRRISELMDNATAYQKQQRYEEALGQLESLLVIDPLNDQAQILKQTLDDMISFYKQLEVWREVNKERVDLLLKTEESAIPYAEELTYPKNWREIVAKRKPEEAIGWDEATAAVYKQLDEIVDLSELTPEMPLSEAIEIIRNSVEPPLKIQPDWRDLYDNADIDQTTPINMEPISGVSVRTALEILLDMVSTAFAELGYVVKEGVITIATVDSLPSELTTLVYDVTDLLGRPATYYTRSGRGRGEAGRGEDAVEFFEEEEEELERDELEERATTRAGALGMLIQEAVEPGSWDVYGGEGTISLYQNKKLIVRQTLEIHDQIAKLLKDLRKALGHQVAIEARFLLVTESFLEDIGLDIDFAVRLGGKWRHPTIGALTGEPYPGISFDQGSSATVTPDATGVPGTLGGGAPLGMRVEGGWGSILDDLQVNFLLRATQAHRDATSLTAPKVTVLTGESAALRVQRTIRYARNIEAETREAGEWAGRAAWTVNYETGAIPTGTILNITPTITPDKRNVLLNIVAELRDFLGWRRQAVESPIFGIEGAREAYVIEFPETEISRVQTRVSVPDGGTLLLGGQKVTGEVEKEAGVPILSKIPLIGRAFTNRSKVKDEKILLILVKPTIILREEAEAEAIAAVEGGF